MVRMNVPPVLSVVSFGIICAAVVMYRMRRTARQQIRAVYFGLMVLESVFYAACLGVAVNWMTVPFLNATLRHTNEYNVTEFVIGLGSGVYEELVFRLLFISIIGLSLRRFVRNSRLLVYAIAVLVSSLTFALFHYLTVFTDSFRASLFAFRFGAGVVFSALFLLRGYGIAAYTHSLYNVFLLFR